MSAAVPLPVITVRTVVVLASAAAMLPLEPPIPSPLVAPACARLLK